MVVTQEDFIQTLSEESHNVADLIRRFGSPPSVILLDPSCHIFSLPHIEGFIGYRLEFGHAVVIGDPVCADADREELTIAFHADCRKKRLDVIYVLASQEFAQWAMQNVCRVLIESGDFIVVDPENDPAKGRKGEKLRWKVHQSQKEGITIEEYIGYQLKIEEDLKSAVKKWVQMRKGVQIYLGAVDLFANRSGTRWFYAKRGEEILGLIILKQVDKHQGWAANFFMTLQDAPTGTSEALIMSVIEKLRSENCRFLLLGAGPGKRLGEVRGLNPIITFLARHLFKVVNWFFHLEARTHYFHKFKPNPRPFYILFSSSRAKLSCLRALMRVLNISA